MPSIGLWEWVFIFLIILVIFGPKSLPKVGQALGKGIREFKDAVSGISRQIEEEDRRKPEPPAAQEPQGEPRQLVDNYIHRSDDVQANAPHPLASADAVPRDSQSKA